jgi:hypothetical protein
MKPAKMPRRKSKAAIKRERDAERLELVKSCDRCGKPFEVTRIRTDGSAVCAAGDGLLIGWGNKIRFFCSEACKESFKEPAT